MSGISKCCGAITSGGLCSSCLKDFVPAHIPMTPKTASTGEEKPNEWWLGEQFAKHGYASAGETVFNIPAIIAEAKRLIVEKIRSELPPFLDVEPSGYVPPTDPMLAADQARNFTLKQVCDILSHINSSD